MDSFRQLSQPTRVDGSESLRRSERHGCLFQSFVTVELRGRPHSIMRPKHRALSRIFQRMVTTPLTLCLSLRVHSTEPPPAKIMLDWDWPNTALLSLKSAHPDSTRIMLISCPDRAPLWLSGAGRVRACRNLGIEAVASLFSNSLMGDNRNSRPTTIRIPDQRQ